VHRYKEAKDYIKQCDEKILQINQKEKEEKERLEAKRKRATTRRCIALALIAVVVCTAFVVVTVIIPNNKYQKAISLMEGEDYESAMELFESLDGYKESSSYMKNCKEIIAEYNDALELMNNGDYVTAIEMFESTNGYKNSDEQIEECRNRYYNEAVTLMNNGEYDGAITVFNELDGYKDSNEQIIECNNIIANQEISKIIEAGIGSIVTFGKYGQNNNSFAEEESIEWIVLERQDDKLLVVSKYVLDFQPYGEKNADSNTWEESSLRVWMNNDFYNNAFTEAERKYISSYILDNAMSSGNEKNGEDWVFLLSVGEVKKFFTSELDRVGIITPNYDGTESNINPDTGATWWWVLPQNNEKASYVNSVGRVGNLNVYENAGVRPAMWIKLGN
jgi:tetratricopeptide (TPR) repeat protein